MLQNIQEFKVAVNKQGYYIIIVNGEVVSEMIAKDELAEAIEAVLKDEYGMVADMLKDEED